MASLNSAWGIDIGNRALKAVHLVRRGDGIQIDDFEIIEHEHVLSQAGDNRDSLIQTALANFVQRHGSSVGAVAVGVSGQSSFARFIKLPPVEPSKIPEIVRFEAIQQIPFPLDDVEWSYQLFQNDQSPDVEVGIFAMRRELVNRHLQYFTEANLDVELVQMNPLAVYNAMYFDKRIKGTTMIVDLGAENTDLIIAEGETIWLRSIPIGGNNFTEALVKSFKLKFPKAEELKRNAATSKYGRQILQAMRPVFADLVAEIQRSIGFYASVHRDSRIARVLALGGTFRLPGLQKYLQQNLQLDVSRIDRLGDSSGLDAKVAANFSDNLLSSVSAYGLALQAMGDAPINSSLLPQAIRRERMWRQKTKWFGAAAALFVVGTGIAYGSYFLRHAQADADDIHYADSNQKTIKRGTDLNTRWNAVSASGGADRAIIEGYNNLLGDRDVWSNLIRDVVSVFPPGPETPEDLKKVAAIPRPKRSLMILNDFSHRYLTDINPLLAMKDSEFSLQAGQSNQGVMHAPTFAPGSGYDRAPGYGSGTAAAAAAATPTTALRGYLLTLRCTTPNAGGAAYGTSSVVAALRNLGVTSTSKTYRIERAVVALARKISTDATAPTRGPRNSYGGEGPAVGGVPNAGRGPAPLQAGVPAAPLDPLADPLFPGESIRDDWDLTILVAVSLDPPPKPEAPQVASTDATH